MPLSFSKICVAIAFAIPYYSYAQSVVTPSVNQNIDSEIQNAFKRLPAEKIFIHTSQSSYTAGQTIWYKVYAMAYGKPSRLSNIVYVNLARSDGKVLSANKLPLTDGAGHGSIDIPDTLATGWYQLQSYTAWMLNFKDEQVYRQKIFIQNLRDRHQVSTANASTGHHIVFYPEGGDLMDGAISNIAFKAVDDVGLPINATGQLIINGKPAETKFATAHDGMGSFRLETYAADIYTANILYADGAQQTVTLPAVKKAGIGLTASSGSEFISLKLYNTIPQQNITIVAMQVNGLSTTYPLKLNKGENIVRFKKGEFATGIARFTILDGTNIPVAERLLFINNGDQPRLAAVKDSLSFNAKAANAITLSVKSAEIKPGMINLSASVTDADAENAPAENILSAFLLTDELKGNINNPAYYFANNSDSLQQHLDLVMLTHGWRHFVWDRIGAPVPVFKYQPEKKQFAAGFIKDYDPKKIAKIKLIVTNPDSTKNFINVMPDSTGHFTIDDSTLVGKARVFYDAVDKQNRKTTIKIRFESAVIDSLPVLPDSSNVYTNYLVPKSAAVLEPLQVQQQQVDFSKTKELRQVNIKAARKTPTDVVIANHVNRLIPDRVFDLDMINTPTFPPVNILDYIVGRFPGLEIRRTASGEYGFYYRGINTLAQPGDKSEYVPPAPVFYIDEAIVSGEDMKSISMYDIALVRFVPPPVWFAPLGGGINGAILVYTKNGKDDIGRIGSKGFDQYTLNGYAVRREYAEMNYSNASLSQPDYRTTLLWKPDLSPDANGEIKLKFYNSDYAKHYRVTVQGMAADGSLSCYSKVF